MPRPAPSRRHPDSAELLELAVGIARDAAAVLRERSGDRRAVGLGTKSTPTDVVTEADKAAERLIVSRLSAARPGDGLLGEEGARERTRTGVRWVVDPLDGTVNFLYGIPTYAVSIAAEVDGVVQVGVVLDVVGGELYTARRGTGSYCDGVRLACSGVTELSRALVGTGFGYARARRARQAAVLLEVLPAVRDIRRAGSAALDLCSVARGRLDAYYERGLQPWDLAAGALIAAEAGLVVTGPRGGAPSGELLVAAGPGIAAELRELLGRLGADAG